MIAVSPTTSEVRSSVFSDLTHLHLLHPQQRLLSAATSGADGAQSDFAESDFVVSEAPASSVASGAYVRLASLATQSEPRLRELQTQFIEDYGRELSAKSIFACRTLLATMPELRRPLLSAEPEGNIIATWKDSDQQSLSLRLVGPLLLHYVVQSRHAAPQYGEARLATFFAELPQARQIAS